MWCEVAGQGEVVFNFGAEGHRDALQTLRRWLLDLPLLNAGYGALIELGCAGELLKRPAGLMAMTLHEPAQLFGVWCFGCGSHGSRSPLFLVLLWSNCCINSRSNALADSPNCSVCIWYLLP